MSEGNVVSESYDPEFGSSTNVQNIKDAIADISIQHIDPIIGLELKYILNVIYGNSGKSFTVSLTERELRIIRFCLIRVYDEI